MKLRFFTISPLPLISALCVSFCAFTVFAEVAVKEKGEATKQEVKLEVIESTLKEGEVAKALPVSSDPTQVYGWREKVLIDGMKGKLSAKLDTGALTSSIHAENKELFERDGKKWVRFTVIEKVKKSENSKKKTRRVQLEAPLVRMVRIKEPGGESQTREVVKLNFKLGERKLRGDFSLNNRANMLCPVLIGRSLLAELGWVDAARVNLADKKVMR